MYKKGDNKNWLILIVDDNEENRIFLEVILKKSGYEVKVAQNGKEALEILNKRKIDLIISDILMPVMDGYQLCIEVKNDKRFSNIPFIFYTATYTDPKDEEFALKLGADRFFIKPMNPEEFIAKLWDLMEEVKNNNFITKKPEITKEETIFKLYNERLTKKLNKKMEDLKIEMALRFQVEKELKKSEEKYRSLIEQASDAILLMESDGTLIDVNPATCKILKCSKGDIMGKNIREFIDPEDFEKKYINLKELKNEESLVLEMKIKARDSSIVFSEISFKKLKEGKIQAIARDITLRKKAEEALKESEERYALSAKGANDGLWDWNISIGKIYFSPRWKSMLGYEDEEIQDSIDSWFSLVHPDDIDILKEELKAHLDGIKPHFEVEYRILHKNQTYKWVLSRGLVIRDKEKNPIRMAGSQTDITDRKRAEEQILHDAFHDSLTDLPNRALFEDRLYQACQRAKRIKDFKFSILHLNIDRFKVINESLGHSLGDKILIILAEKIKDLLKPGDTLARFGSDDFFILLEEIKDASEATRFARKIISEVEHPINLEGNEIFLTASIGIVISEEEIKKPEDYLRDANIALHKAKLAGRGNCVIFNAEMYEKVMENLKIESDLRKALEKQEFIIQYQPIYDLHKGTSVGFEALVRWKHPERGLLLPINFLSIAEETGFISAIDQFVLKNSCKNFKKWIDKNKKLENFYVSINFSSKEFSDPMLLDKVTEALKDSKIEPKNLAIEITESTLMQNISNAQTILFQLQNLGIKIFLDDFGTGYSSLNYLHHFSINTLKIDKTFVGQIREKGPINPIVNTIVSLGHTMGMEVLAEGVELEFQLLKLKEIGCNCAQGFFLSHPLEENQIERGIINNL